MVAYGTLTGDVTLAFTNVPASVPVMVTVYFTQNATGGYTVSYPSGTRYLYGGNGAVNPAPSATTAITLFTLNGGTNWHVVAVDTRPSRIDPFHVNPPANGDYYIVFDILTVLDLAGVLKNGTGTLAYAKSTNGGSSFASVSGSTSFASGDILKITVTSFSDWLSFTIPRTA